MRRKKQRKVTDPVLKAREKLAGLTKEEVGEDLDRYRRPHRLERLSRAFYQNIPGVPIDFFNEKWYEEFVNVLGRQRIGSFVVRSSMVLDVTSILFRFILGSPDPSMRAAAHDWYSYVNVRFHMHVNGVNPWDQGFTLAGLVKGPIPGFAQLNTNIFTGNDDMPFHLVIEENSKVEFLYDVSTAVPFNPPDDSLVGAEINGRWIPQSVWNDMKEDLR